MLLARDGPEDRAWAALDAYRELGMETHAATASALTEEISAGA